MVVIGGCDSAFNVDLSPIIDLTFYFEYKKYPRA